MFDVEAWRNPLSALWKAKREADHRLKELEAENEELKDLAMLRSDEVWKDQFKALTRLWWEERSQAKLEAEYRSRTQAEQCAIDQKIVSDGMITVDEQPQEVSPAPSPERQLVKPSDDVQILVRLARLKEVRAERQQVVRKFFMENGYAPNDVCDILGLYRWTTYLFQSLLNTSEPVPEMPLPKTREERHKEAVRTFTKWLFAFVCRAYKRDDLLRPFFYAPGTCTIYVKLMASVLRLELFEKGASKRIWRLIFP